MADKKKHKAPVPAPQPETPPDPTYPTDQLLASERFRHRRDVAAAVLTPGAQYTVEAAEAAVTAYLQRKVK